MSKITDLLKPADIQKATRTFETTRFNFATYTKLLGLTELSLNVMLEVFDLLDKNNDGYVDETEARLILLGFSPEGRVLSDEETRDFLSAGGKNGKISRDDFIAMVKRS
ncbi:parvalbumin, muscle-like [Phyllobates terribilis]|uniref:parvalbumin, muscle-like n=1 Tax=Phyllobates terribilis TaxID=111132 RepID=UPI003CCAD5E3